MKAILVETGEVPAITKKLVSLRKRQSFWLRFRCLFFWQVRKERIEAYKCEVAPRVPRLSPEARTIRLALEQKRSARTLAQRRAPITEKLHWTRQKELAYWYELKGEGKNVGR